MTDYAQRIHSGLVAEGFDTESDDYYNELTNEELKTSFQSLLKARIRLPEALKSPNQSLLHQGLQPLGANLLS